MVGYRIAYNLGTLLSMDDVLLCSTLADKKYNVDSIWVPESWGREAFASLGALSQRTKQVKLGTSIISIYARTPATVAMARYYIRFSFKQEDNHRSWSEHLSHSRKLAWIEIRTTSCKNARILRMLKADGKSR